MAHNPVTNLHNLGGKALSFKGQQAAEINTWVLPNKSCRTFRAPISRHGWPFEAPAINLPDTQMCPRAYGPEILILSPFIRRLRCLPQLIYIIGPRQTAGKFLLYLKKCSCPIRRILVTSEPAVNSIQTFKNCFKPQSAITDPMGPRQTGLYLNQGRTDCIWRTKPVNFMARQGVTT